MGLRDIGATLPPGFRFYPSDEELVCHYLYKKIVNDESLKGTLVEVDLHICEPWQLPEVAKLNATEWYFFSFRDRKYATGYRTNRATTSGYWKATGKDRTVVEPRTHEVVGMRKTLVFYLNRAPNGTKTGWIMHEFRLETPHMPPKEDWVLCRVFNKGKGEDISAPTMIFDTTSNVVPNRTLTCGYEQLMASLSSGSTTPHQQHSQSLLRTNNNDNVKSNSLVLSREISSKELDDYGFLWDMNLDEYQNMDHGRGAVSNLEDMKFEIDNNMVIL